MGSDVDSVGSVQPAPVTVTVTVTVAASPARVWQALVTPAEVTQWDGARPRQVPAGYPAPGQHARWAIRLAGWPVTLHDRIRAVEPPRRLASTITVGMVHVDEEYRLIADGSDTRLMLVDRVSSPVPGVAWLAAGWVRRTAGTGLARLAELCEADRPAAGSGSTEPW